MYYYYICYSRNNRYSSSIYYNPPLVLLSRRATPNVFKTQVADMSVSLNQFPIGYGKAWYKPEDIHVPIEIVFDHLINLWQDVGHQLDLNLATCHLIAMASHWYVNELQCFLPLNTPFVQIAKPAAQLWSSAECLCNIRFKPWILSIATERNPQVETSEDVEWSISNGAHL